MRAVLADAVPTNDWVKSPNASSPAVTTQTRLALSTACRHSNVDVS